MMDLWVSDSLLHGVEQTILGLLVVLGVACVAVFLCRWVRVRGAKQQAVGWRDILAQDLTGKNFTDQDAASKNPAFSVLLSAPTTSTASKKSREPMKPTAPVESGTSEGLSGVVQRNTPEKMKGEKSDPAYRLAKLGLDNAHLAPEALEKLLETQEIREKKGLEMGAQFLGTVGANAPFLGLTGTVLGILGAFRQMAEQGGSGGVEVMSAIAGALIATAAGLMVAIPAVVLYNLLKSAIRDTRDALAEIRGLLLARSFHSASEEVV